MAKHFITVLDSVMPTGLFGLPWNKIDAWRGSGLRIAAADGCFDLLHPGHVRMLDWAAGLADKLVVLLPDDASVAAAKAGRPFAPLPDRMDVVAALRAVDAVGHYGQDDLAAAYAALRPDILVNSPEWVGCIVGQAEVEAAGGRVELFPRIAGRSTSDMIARIRNS